MRQPGQNEVEKAKADGRWANAYMSQGKAVVPPDLKEVLKNNKTVRDHFYALSKTDQYSIIFGLVTARTPEARIKKLNKLISALPIK